MFDVVFPMQDDDMMYTNKYVSAHEQGVSQ